MKSAVVGIECPARTREFTGGLNPGRHKQEERKRKQERREWDLPESPGVDREVFDCTMRGCVEH